MTRTDLMPGSMSGSMRSRLCIILSRALRAAPLAALLALGAASPAQASGGGSLPYSYTPDGGNLASLQRGARNYMYYCSGCHSMKHLRYSRIGSDLEISEPLLRQRLMLTSDKPGDPILSAMSEQDAMNAFGTPPPDLSVETRLRGVDWVYSYLMSFYLDPSRPLGTNNRVMPNAAMPHVLGSLQGWQVQVAHDEAPGGAHGEPPAPKLELAQPGSLKPDEYARFVGDLVNFMHYAAEPGRAHRFALGRWVLLYLLLLTTLLYLLKREIWKDIH